MYKRQIYGMGHAVYSLSDPRANIFKACVKRLSEEKGLDKEYQLYALVERLAPQKMCIRDRLKHPRLLWQGHHLSRGQRTGQ